MEFKTVKIDKPEDMNIIIGQSHFIKTVEDVREAMVGAVPGIKFGLAFCEASGPCLVRRTGTDPELERIAVMNAEKVGCGHSFILVLGNAFPVNVLKRLQAVDEIVGIFCATANPVSVLVAEENGSRALLGVFDGLMPKGVEKEEDIKKRKEFLRKIGYKE